ncbi:PREDICTED: EPIDERMAL PATTERNING FACTOR-like protein 6 [Lupinus angustifolius]|uniref:EPIDERMAL PATTERNING FACTOR-like protein 6 n=1 Tax=Lupinus angustifolius TaxID=3871 RepID=UPI00092EA0ED|nr:PREDICTED: EPIDERMAL PATTERNING FACTOR-like protein 6 [Lupinus angustifolius]
MERKKNTNINKVINKTNLYGIVSFFFMLSIFTLIFSTATGTTITCIDARRCTIFAKANTDSPKFEERIRQGMIFEGIKEFSLGWARRFLGGPGSSPPQCTSKCGNCTPCTPVHLPVPPGTPVIAEYYPEAWRCKCGNKLNLP